MKNLFATFITSTFSEITILKIKWTHTEVRVYRENVKTYTVKHFYTTVRRFLLPGNWPWYLTVFLRCFHKRSGSLFFCLLDFFLFHLIICWISVTPCILSDSSCQCLEISFTICKLNNVYLICYLHDIIKPYNMKDQQNAEETVKDIVDRNHLNQLKKELKWSVHTLCSYMSCLDRSCVNDPRGKYS